jgi:filamentous hemagglutinin family protein
MKHTPDFSSRFRILKGGKISLVVSALVAGSTMTFASPGGGVVQTGSATISQSGSITNINQSTQRASINWQSFSIGATETVNFNQPNSSAVTLNRVVGNESSLINGALNANGQVWILNSNGILFGKGASVNTAGLVASTMNITDQNFMNGKYTFESTGSSASVINLGTIHVTDGAYVALLGKEVANAGLIQATKGTVALTAGDKVSLNFNGNSLVGIAIDQGTLNALVENKGAIIADGGSIFLTTKAANDLINGVVNNTGLLQAQTLDDVTGHIEVYAHGGTATVSGTLDATGGFIETSGNKLGVAEGTVIKAKEWLLDPTDIIISIAGDTGLGGGFISGATINTALNAGTSVTLSATHDIVIVDIIDKSSGGSATLELNAGHDIVFGYDIIPAWLDENTPNVYGKILQTGNPAGNLFVNLFARNRLIMSDVGNEINVKGDITIGATQGFYLRNISSTEGSIFADTSSTVIPGANGSIVNGILFGKNGVSLSARADTDNALTIAAGSSIDTTNSTVDLEGFATAGYKGLTIEGNSEVPTNIGLNSSNIVFIGYTPGFAAGIELGTVNVGNSNSLIYLNAGGHAANGDSIVFQPLSTQNFQASSMSINSNQNMYINSSLSTSGSELVLSDITKFTTLVPDATLNVGNDYYGHNRLNIGNTIDLSTGNHAKLTFYGANDTDIHVGDSAGGAILLQGTVDKPISIFKQRSGIIIFGESSTPSATTTLTLNHVDVETWDNSSMMFLAASNDIKILNSTLMSGTLLMAGTNDSITVDGSTLSANGSGMGAIILESNRDDNGGAIVVNNSTLKSTSDVGIIAMSGGSAFSLDSLFSGTGSGYAKGIDAAGYTNGVMIHNSTIGGSTKNTSILIQGESASVGHALSGDYEYYLAKNLDSTSNVTNGVLISGASALYSGTSDLSISGKMADQTDTGSLVYGTGVFIMGNTDNKTTLNSTTGNITITGDATSVTRHTNRAAWFKGVDLQNTSLLSTSGNITLDGKTSSQVNTHVGTEGIDLDGVSITTEGNLNIDAISGGGSSAFRTLSQWGNNFITADNLAITASNSLVNNQDYSVNTMSSAGQNGWFNNANDVWTLGGDLNIASTNGFGISIGSQLLVAGTTTLNVSSRSGDTYLENAANEIHTLAVTDTRFLSLVTTQALDVSNLSSRGDVYLQSGGDININGAVSIGANSGAYFIADSAHGGKFTVADGVSNIQLGEGSKYYIYSSSPSVTQLGSYAPDFSVYEKSYDNYSNPMLHNDGNGVIYFGAAEVTPTPEPTPAHITTAEHDTEKVITAIVNTNTVHIEAPHMVQEQLRVEAPRAPTYSGGREVSLVSAPSEGQSVQRISMNEVLALQKPTQSSSGGSLASTVQETRVALYQDSVVDLVNGGVSLPMGVHQEFYVVKNDASSNTNTTAAKEVK